MKEEDIKIIMKQLAPHIKKNREKLEKKYQKKRFICENKLTKREAEKLADVQSGAWGEPSNIIYRKKKKYFIRKC